MGDLYSYLDGSATSYTDPTLTDPTAYAGGTSPATGTSWYSGLLGLLNTALPVAGQVFTGQQQSDAQRQAAQLAAATAAQRTSVTGSTMTTMMMIGAVVGVIVLVIALVFRGKSK